MRSLSRYIIAIFMWLGILLWAAHASSANFYMQTFEVGPVRSQGGVNFIQLRGSKDGGVVILSGDPELPIVKELKGSSQKKIIITIEEVVPSSGGRW